MSDKRKSRPPAGGRNRRTAPPGRGKARPAKARKAPAAKLPIPANATYLIGHHAVAAALMNPERQCRSLWLTESAEKTLAQALDDATSAGLKRPVPQRVERAALDATLGRDVVHQGALLLCDPLPEIGLDDVLIELGDAERATVMLLDQVTDPHNIGAVMRSAAAFGLSAIIMPRRGAPGITPALAKTATGAADMLPLVTVTNLGRALLALKDAGFSLFGLDERAETPLSEARWAPRSAIILGAEGRGMRQSTREACDMLVSLPTTGPIRSLNVSNAAAITLFARISSV